MAASVYATPPPDLSEEDTALSDASNSSQTNSSNNSQSQPKKRALSANSFLSTSTSPSIMTMCASTATDSSEFKKRRKQTTPIRISASVGGITTATDVSEIEQNGDNEAPSISPATVGCEKGQDKIEQISLANKPETILIPDSEAAIKLLQNQDEIKETNIKSPDSIKKEEIEWDGEIKRKFPTKPEDWLQLAGLTFPFPPEAASFLPQLSLLGVPPVPTYNGDGSQRSTMPRIFNPEAFCDLCNKEFCNKYFLKTHKANKHGIYESPVSSADLPSVNLNQLQISQTLFLQPQSQKISMGSQESSFPNFFEPTVYCDICLKKFNNVFAMRKHRGKVHEQIKNSSNGGAANESNEENVIKMPEGFREDYSVEQEDVSFTPQIRKLSPGLIQQARDANFAVDKLMRLGVLNPDAFCELCGKEYCNKYFLRTHKLKRHGIIPPPECELKEDRPSWHTIQTSPLNLIMADSKPNGELQKKKFKDELSDEDDEKESPKTLSQTDSEAISVDLQKLQSMIMHLNDLSAQRAVTCSICNKEFETHYMLHTHMLAEHSIENNNKNLSSPSANEMESCKHCDKQFANAFLLKQHLVEAHCENPSPPRDGFVTPDRPPLIGISVPPVVTTSDRRPSYTMTPTSSYCEICNKELCNKYFMKTHMQRMHGIEIENGAQIGGVVCNICNKELCSKYFLRVHKHNTHGIVEESSPLPQPRSQNGDSMDGGDSFSPASMTPEVSFKPGEVSDNRYFSHFTEVCTLCNRRFRSPKWLKAHLMSDHGKAGTDKFKELETKQNNFIKPTSPALKVPNGAFGLPSPDQNLLTKSALSLFTENAPSKLLFNHENTAPSSSSSGSSAVKGYQCSFCSFSTPILPFLFIHERSHSTLISSQSESAVSLAKDRFQPPFLPSNSSSEEPNSTLSASTPLSAQDPLVIKSPEFNILNEMANLTQRPAVYALPQEAGSYIMQSFFVKEKLEDSRFVPVIVFLPVKERITSPINVSFNLTPA